jgi:uncharacterized membrane protein YcaP (DUF421 family)
MTAPGSRPFRFGDLERLVRGATPWTFCLEVILRIVVLYAILLIALRLMGRRMSTQLTRNELLALVCLAAAIGPAIQAPERGLLPPVVVAALVVMIQRGIGAYSFRNHRFEDVLEGKVRALVTDGCLDLKALRRNSLSSARLFAELRVAGIVQLGQIERVLFEPGGAFAILRFKEERPGLSLAPEWDRTLVETQTPDATLCACGQCGFVVEQEVRAGPCPACAARSWAAAVRSH